MLYLIKNREESENLELLASLQSQVEALAVRLQDKLGQQIFHEDMEKL